MSASTQSLIDQIASSSNPGAAMAQLTPTAFQSLTAVGISGAFQTTQVVDQRLSAVRDGGLAFDNSGLGTAMALLNKDYSRASMPGPFDPSNAGTGLAYVQAPAQDPAFAALAKAAGSGPNFYKAPRMVEGDTPWGMFLYGNAVFARQKATATAPESKFTATGVTGGIDRRITQNLVLGLLGGYSRTNAELDTLGSTSKINTWLLGAYGTYYRQNWFVNGAFVYGRNSYDNNRIALGTANVSNPKGDQYALQGSVGADFRYGLWTVTPELGAQYTTVRVDGFTETGAAALNVGADKTDSLRSSVGRARALRLADRMGPPDAGVARQLATRVHG
ncbi:MAG: autotransporter outer membrane beta-barrel domain-containing protein [Pseudolabrys sp.]